MEETTHKITIRLWLVAIDTRTARARERRFWKTKLSTNTNLQ